MRQKIRRATKVVATLATLVIVSLVAPALPAQALTMPHLQFPAANLAPDMAYSRHLISQTDGGVTIGCNGQGAAAFESVSGTGSVAQSVSASSNPTPTGLCNNTSAVGQDGAVYTAAYYGSSDWTRIAAYKAGAQQWVYTAPCRDVTSMVVGTNGNLYFVSSDCNDGQHVVGLKPTLDAGATSPTVVVNMSLPRGAYFTGALSAYSGGLAVRYNDGVGYFDYSGNPIPTAPEWHAQLGYFDGQAFTTADTGRAFVSVAADVATQQFCGNTNATSAIAAYEPTGFKWSAALPACSQVYGIRPLYTGGAVAYIATRDNAANTVLELYAVSPAGGNVPMWTMPLTGPAGATWYDNKFATDLNGTVVLEQPFVRNETTSNGGNLDFFGVRLALISGFTGALEGSTELSGGLTDGYGFNPLDSDAIPAIANNVAYVAAAHCNGYKLCDYSTASLYAVSLPGVSLDYPRGAVLTGITPSRLNYVAMGDSFSSGEGAPASTDPGFLPGSDTAGPPVDFCHRSNQAYSQWLAANSTFRLQLTNFVACSGATTASVLNGWPTGGPNTGEGQQVNALDSSTNVVTLTIGGNDIGFGDFVYNCLFDDCSTTAISQPFFDNIDNNLAGNGVGPELSGLLGVYAKIKTKAPNAKVYVLGYPQLLPEQGCKYTDDWMRTFAFLAETANDGVQKSIDTLRGLGSIGHIPQATIDELIATGKFEFNAAETATARLLVQKLDVKIQQTVASLNDSHFVYIDPLATNSPFIGHELCTSQSYFNGLDATNEPYSFHPNPLGQEAYYGLFIANR